MSVADRQIQRSMQFKMAVHLAHRSVYCRNVLTRHANGEWISNATLGTIERLYALANA